MLECIFLNDLPARVSATHLVLPSASVCAEWDAVACKRVSTVSIQEHVSFSPTIKA